MKLGLRALILSNYVTATSVCRSSSAITCSDCLSLGPECNWCSAGPSEDDFIQNRIRCGTRQELIDDDCNNRDIVKIKIGIEKERNSSTHVFEPEYAEGTLRYGATITHELHFRRPEFFEVDMYYIMGTDL